MKNVTTVFADLNTFKSNPNHYTKLITAIPPFDVLDKAAQNEGAGAGILGASMGMGMGVNVGGMIGSAMGNAVTNVVPSQAIVTQSVALEKICPKCNCKLTAEAKFCFQCGTKLDNVCPDCNEPIMPGARFCQKCGKKLSDM